MRYEFPKEIKELGATIPDEYFAHPEAAPQEYRERIELYKKKAKAFCEQVEKEAFEL